MFEPFFFNDIQEDKKEERRQRKQGKVERSRIKEVRLGLICYVGSVV